MVLSLGFMPLVQASVIRDTIVTLTMPAQRTAFDYASGTLQILVLVVGLIALASMALMTLTLRKAVVSLQGTVERLSADAKPLLSQATRVSEEVRDVVKTVRGEVNRIADASAELSERMLDLSDAAETRINEVNALLDVLQDEVEDTALSAAAAVRGARVGAVALGAAFGLRKRPRPPSSKIDKVERSYFDDDDAARSDDDADGEYEEEDEFDDEPLNEPPADERPYLDAEDDEYDEPDAWPEDHEDPDADSRDERPRASSKHRR